MIMFRRSSLLSGRGIKPQGECVWKPVSVTLCLTGPPPVEIQHYAFQPVNVMTTYLYPITPESIQSPGGEPNMALFHMSRNWTDISKPQEVRGKFAKSQTESKRAPAVVNYVTAGACVSICVSAQCILAWIFPVFMLTWRGVHGRGLR